MVVAGGRDVSGQRVGLAFVEFGILASGGAADRVDDVEDLPGAVAVADGESRLCVFGPEALETLSKLEGAEEERRSLLVDALNELLYAELLAVKRTLGSVHEASIVKALLEQP